MNKIEVFIIDYMLLYSMIKPINYDNNFMIMMRLYQLNLKSTGYNLKCS